MPLIRKFWEMYLEWDVASILFNKAELTKLHRQFKHPSVENLMNLLKRSKIKDVDEVNRKMLEERTLSNEIVAQSQDRLNSTVPQLHQTTSSSTKM